MNKLSFNICILTLVLAILIIRIELTYLSFNPSINTLAYTTESGWRIEPQTPENIEDPPFSTLPFPQNEVPIPDVLEKGTELPIQFIYNDPEWKRPAFKEYWHSKYGRWSYVPSRIHFAMHRIFSTYATASIYYDFIHDLGIAEESNNFTTYESASPYDYLQVVVMNTFIKKMITYENQIVIIGRPQRTGLQTIIIPTKEIKPIATDQNILIQLATPDGDEMDYTIDQLVHPDLNKN